MRGKYILWSFQQCTISLKKITSYHLPCSSSVCGFLIWALRFFLYFDDDLCHCFFGLIKYHHNSITKVWKFTELVVWAFCVSLTELGGLPHIFSIEFSVLLLCCELWNWGQICRGCEGARPNSKRNPSTPFLKRSLRFQIQRWSNLKGMAESRSSGL